MSPAPPSTLFVMVVMVTTFVAFVVTRRRRKDSSPPPAALLLASNMAADIQALMKGKKKKERLWVGIAGMPGAGKSTLATALVEQLNRTLYKALVVPMDGYHFYRKELDAMQDPKTAHARRGAPFTFNAEKFATDLKQAKNSLHFAFPDFDHGVGDPRPDAIHLTPDVQIVVVEGNYLLLQEPQWMDARRQLDFTYFLHVDKKVAMEQLAQRHARVWGWSIEKARDRVRASDELNADLVQHTMAYADSVVESQ